MSPSPAEAPGPTAIDGARPDRKRAPSRLVWLSLVLAAVLLYTTLRDLDWSAFWNTIKSGHYEILLLTIPIASANYFLRAVRWSVLVRSETKVAILSVFWANMVGYMGNAYLPARAGELLRSAFLGQKKGLGTSFVLATALSERILDAVTLVLVGSVALVSHGQIAPPLASGVRLMAGVAVLGLAVLLTAPFQELRIVRILGRLPLPETMSQTICQQAVRFLIGMRSLQNARRMVAFALLTAVIWLVDALGSCIGVRIISQTLSLSQAMILLAALGLSSAVPSTPGYVGVYQYVAVTVLMPFGFSRPEALAYILIGQVLNYMVVSFWGLLGLWRINAHSDSAGTPAEP